MCIHDISACLTSSCFISLWGWCMKLKGTYQTAGSKTMWLTMPEANLLSAVSLTKRFLIFVHTELEHQKIQYSSSKWKYVACTLVTFNLGQKLLNLSKIFCFIFCPLPTLIFSLAFMFVLYGAGRNLTFFLFTFFFNRHISRRCVGLV